MDLEKSIRVVEDFPKKGISFKDISPLLYDPKTFNYALDEMAKLVKDLDFSLIVGPESRGFVFGAPLASKMNKGFVMARKKGKLPGEVISKTYTLEYNTATIELPAFAIKKGTRVLLCDDLLATGGTLEAVRELIEQEGGVVVGAITLIELNGLNGKANLKGLPYFSLLKL